MNLKILGLLPLLAGCEALAGCSINPRFDVSYTANKAPSAVDFLDKMYCELMETADNIDKRHFDDFLKEDMTTIITLQVVGQDATSPTASFPAIGPLLLAVTGNGTRQRTNIMTLTYDFPIGDLYNARHTANVDCAKVQADLLGELDIEKVVDAAYGAADDVSFVLPPTTKTATGGSFSGETDFMVTRSLNPLKLSFVLSPIVGPNTFTFSDVYTDKLQFTFTPPPTPPKQPEPIPVYAVQCPPKVKDCVTVHQLANPPAATNGKGGTVVHKESLPAMRQLNPDALQQLNQLNLLTLPSTLNTQ